MTRRSLLYDRSDSFGWISIVLHWFTAVTVIVLWLVGQSIMSQPVAEIDARRSLHITVGLIAWVPLVVRIAWRLRVSHPHVSGQSRFIHQLACINHYLMLATLTVMIITGPLLAWALPGRTGIAAVAGLLHANAAKLMLVLVILHVLGALKHLMFHDDETIARIFMPRKRQMDETD